MQTQTMSQIHIRPATPDDVATILAFIRELADYEKLSHAVVASEELLHEHLFGAQPAAEVLIGECDGAPVGYALFFRTFSTFLARPGLYLEDVYVQPPFRGRGLGKALLKALAQLAVARGYGRVEWSVLNWNAPSIAFYQSLGAEPLDEWTTYRLTGEALQELGRGSSD
jgi:GNAT superfamily N-acetyltransferase